MFKIEKRIVRICGSCDLNRMKEAGVLDLYLSDCARRWIPEDSFMTRVKRTKDAHSFHGLSLYSSAVLERCRYGHVLLEIDDRTALVDRRVKVDVLNKGDEHWIELKDLTPEDSPFKVKRNVASRGERERVKIEFGEF